MGIEDYNTVRDDNATIVPGNIRTVGRSEEQQYVNSIRQLMADLATFLGGDAPFEHLTISSANPYVDIEDTDTSVNHRISGNSSSGHLILQADYNSDAATPFLYVQIKGSTVFRIGTTGILYLEDIIRAIDGTIDSPGYAFTSDPNTGIYREGSGDIRVTCNGSQAMGFTSSVVTLFADQVQAPSGDAGDPPYSFVSDTSMGMYRRANNDIGFSVNGAEEFSVRGSSSGRIFNQASYDNTSAASATAGFTTTGGFYRSTSSMKWKRDAEPADLEYSKKLVYNSEPIWFHSLANEDNPEWSYWGFSAEQVAGIDPRMAHWAYPLKEVEEEFDDFGKDRDGNVVPIRRKVKTKVEDKSQPPTPEGVMYDRYVVHLVNVLQDQKKELDALRAEMEELRRLIT